MSETPTVYFIDDSATMREVIKIAFRRENINVVACHDAATAISKIEHNVPDVVISDVIMPDKDGYEVCQFIKQHPRLGKTPVILMSGVVNRTVAEKAFAVKADELIRKPFQPQDLITRVKTLLRLPGAPVVAPPPPPAMTAALTSIFAPAAAAAAPTPPTNGSSTRTPAPRSEPVPAPAASPSPLAPAFAAVAAPSPAVAPPHPASAPPRAVPPLAAPVVPAGQRQAPVQPAARTAMAGSVDAPKLKLEIMRLENLVKKLQSELEAERQYTRALEEHVKTLQDSE
jgi:CheY-like chemotaxis protein